MIRRLEPHEWELLRELRLEALACEPRAFGATYAESATRGAEAWRGWATSGRCFVAELDGRPVGLGSWYEDEDGHAILVSMYIRAEARSLGLGAALVEAICSAAREAAHERISLGVTEGSAARRLYERCGFAATGKRYRLRDGSEHFAESMARTL
jgi:GNAT superfamily N-acetyltransferase